MKILKNRVFIGLMCVILALVIGFVAVPAYQSLVVDMVDVVVAKQDISPGTLLTEDMFSVTQMNKNGVPEDVAHSVEEVMFRSNEYNQKIQLYAITKIMQGYYVTARQVAERLVDPQTKIRNMKPGETTLSIGLKNVNTVTLYPNDVIAIYALSNGQYVSIPNLKAVSVVCCLSDDNVEIVESGQVSGQAGVNPATLAPAKVQFILNQEQARTLVSYAGTTSLWFSLIYRGENQAYINQLLSQNSVS